MPSFKVSTPNCLPQRKQGTLLFIQSSNIQYSTQVSQVTQLTYWYVNAVQPLQFQLSPLQNLQYATRICTVPYSENCTREAIKGVTIEIVKAVQYSTTRLPWVSEHDWRLVWLAVMSCSSVRTNKDHAVQYIAYRTVQCTVQFGTVYSTIDNISIQYSIHWWWEVVTNIMHDSWLEKTEKTMSVLLCLSVRTVYYHWVHRTVCSVSPYTVTVRTVLYHGLVHDCTYGFTANNILVINEHDILYVTVLCHGLLEKGLFLVVHDCAGTVLTVDCDEQCDNDDSVRYH